GAVLERRAVTIASRIEGAENIDRELSGLLEHGIDEVLGEVAIDTIGHGLAEACGVLERKGHVDNRRLVGHGRPCAWGGMGGRREACCDIYPARHRTIARKADGEAVQTIGRMHAAAKRALYNRATAPPRRRGR